VTALCLTRNRPKWLRQAIQGFQNQTYQNKKLLVLADGEDVREIAIGENVRYVHIEEGRSIGEKRNFGTRLADSQIVANWDDDDWSHPARLADQLERLRESGKSVTGYHSMLFTDGRQWWKYIGTPNYALGTSLCYRRDWALAHPFPAKWVCEDGDFVREANIAGQLISVDALEMMIASVHNSNTSPRNLQHEMYRIIDPKALISGENKCFEIFR
jgi:glycosyltransferase involved in cell wall biosynthesis